MKRLVDATEQHRLANAAAEMAERTRLLNAASARFWERVARVHEAVAEEMEGRCCVDASRHDDG